ncbi:MAG: alpha/beta hydrolase [Candidatus Margulisiibacteriota bacterium]|jgi:pimeloyl-ACP methyl ester carboxylesterase
MADLPVINEETVSLDFAPLWLSSQHFVLPRPSNIRRFTIEKKKGRVIQLDLHQPKEPAPKAPTIIIFPGCAGNSYDLINIARRFAADGFLAWTVDYSVGDVARHDFSEYTISELVADISLVVDFVHQFSGVDQEQLFIAGHSFGSFSSFLYAARNHDPRIKAVIGICPVYDVVELGFNHFNELTQKFARLGQHLRIFAKRSKRQIKKVVFFFWRLTGKLFVIKRNGSWAVLTKVFLDDIIGVNSREKVLGDIAGIEQPCLLLYGENDPWISEANVEEIYADIKNDHKAMKVLKGEGHLPLDKKGADLIYKYTVAFLKQYCPIIPVKKGA